jgi:hypothetical protein
MKKPSTSKKPHKPKTPKADLAKKSAKKKYKVRNWKEYNESLVNRGRIIFHITQEALDAWESHERTGKRGKPPLFSDSAIETVITIQQYFRLPLRATEGLIATMLHALGSPAKSPDYSTLSKRGKTLSISFRVRPQNTHTQEPIHLLVDSSGIKVYGEGEWKVRQHGISKRRTWKKLHLGFDEATRDVVAVVMTGNDTHDSEVFPELLTQVSGTIKQVSNDGGYDTASCYEAIETRGARAIIPPRKDAKIWRHGNTRGDPHPRDVNLRRIRKVEDSGRLRVDITDVHLPRTGSFGTRPCSVIPYPLVLRETSVLSSLCGVSS